MRRTLASPIFAISSKRPSAIFAEVLSASMRTARRGERASEGMTASRVQSNGGFHMRVAPLNDLIFNRITIQSDCGGRVASTGHGEPVFLLHVLATAQTDQVVGSQVRSGL